VRRSGLHQIGAVAREVGLPLQVVRDCAESGLVRPSGHAAGGFDLYTDADVARLRLVRQMRHLQVTDREMRCLVAAHDVLCAAEPVDLVGAEAVEGDAPEVEPEPVDAGSGPEQVSADELSDDDLRRLTTGELFADELEQLGRGDLSGAERGRILDRLTMFSAAVEERCRQLTEQLDEAEVTAATLRREIRRHSRFIEMRG
jgi:DNA-binding transcriptional MerR regulator